jgi:hypothetical protein
MSTPTRNDASGLSRTDHLAVSGAAMSSAPWAAAGAAGAVVAGGDLILHLMLWQFGIGSLLSSISLGTVAFFAVAGGGALWRTRRGRALAWARRNPWRFAVLPGAACAIVLFVLAIATGSGIIGGAFTALWHGALAYGLTGVVGSVGSSRRSRS